MSRTLSSFVLGLRGAAGTSHQPPRVIVVESRPTVRELLCRDLHRLGCATMEAATPLETIRVLEWARAVVQAVVIGPTLTQTRAEELASFVHESYPDLPVFLVEHADPDRTWDLRDSLRDVARGVSESFASVSRTPAPG